MDEELEELASDFHDVYIKEAKRQGDVRHKDKYEDLPENIKEFDRVLAKHFQRLLIEARIESANLALCATQNDEGYKYIESLKKQLTEIGGGNG